MKGVLSVIDTKDEQRFIAAIAAAVVVAIEPVIEEKVQMAVDKAIEKAVNRIIDIRFQEMYDFMNGVLNTMSEIYRETRHEVDAGLSRLEHQGYHHERRLQHLEGGSYRFTYSPES